MGYFSNGSEGDCYRAEYCFKCANWEKRPGDDVEGCPIMDLHFAWSYKLCNSKSLGKKFLDFFIPPAITAISAKGEKLTLPFNGKCRMFLPKGAP
jgi:hypothetical protein